MIIQFENCIKFFSKVVLDELKDVCITWVGGGCVRDYFSIGYISSGIDLFFSCVEDFEKAKKYFLEQKKVEIKKEEDGKIIIEKKNKPLAYKKFENENVLKISYKKRDYDLVKKYFPSASETIKEFDFTVCCASVDIHNVYTHETFFIDLAKRQLMLNKLPFPHSTMWRMQKYIKKGYTICSGEMTKLAKAISEVQTSTQTDDNIHVIEDNGMLLYTTFD